MKKKKLEAKLTKTKKKLANAKTQLNEMLGIMEKSGMPKAAEKPAAGKKAAVKSAKKTTATRSTAKAAPSRKTASKAKVKPKAVGK